LGDADWRFLAGGAVVFAAITVTWVAVGSPADGIPAGLFALVLAVMAVRRRRGPARSERPNKSN
jgi:hypothetical protein